MLHEYISHGGTILTSHLFRDLFHSWGSNIFSWVEDWFVSLQELVLTDDMQPLAICSIGVIAATNPEFRDRVKRKLYGYRAPTSKDGSFLIDALFETHFGAAAVQYHRRKFAENQNYYTNPFTARLCIWGSPSMLAFGADLDIDLHRLHGPLSMLGQAAVAGNLENARFLLDAGANGALAVFGFLSISGNLSDSVFRDSLALLVEHARPTSFRRINRWVVDPHEHEKDALLHVLGSNRAMSLFPEGVEILMAHDVVDQNRLFVGSIESIMEGSSEHRGSPCGRFSNAVPPAYIYVAILKGRPRVVDSLLRRCQQAKILIGHYLWCICDDKCFWHLRSWFTLAVDVAAVACVEVMLQYGADIVIPDGTGVSALQRATLNASSHVERKKYDIAGPYFTIGPMKISKKAEAETLAVLERAFHQRFQGKKDIEEYKYHSKRSAETRPIETIRPTTWKERLLESTAEIFDLPAQIKLLKYRFHKIPWRSWRRSFFQCVLIQFTYILSYGILFIVEISAFIWELRRFPMPPRILLSAVAVLVLAVVLSS